MRHLHLAVFAAVLVLLAAAPAAGAAATPPPAPVPTQLGAFANEPGGIAALEQELGYHLSIDHIYVPWTFTSWARRLAPDIAAGRTPLLSWSAAPDTTAAAIASGSQDVVITQAALALKAVGVTVYLRPFYEFDQPLGHPRYIGTPAQVVAAWQRLVGLFRAAGATNVKFVWCPMAFDYANGVAQQFWPGAADVDDVGADGYDFPGARWSSFGRIFTAAYDYSIAEARPLFIAETAANALDPRGPAWLAAGETWVAAHPNVAVVVYFDSISPKGYDFRLYANQPMFLAYQAWGLNPAFG